MKAVDKLKTEIDLLEHIKKSLGQEGKKETEGVRFKSGNENTPSLLVYKDSKRGYNDFSGRLGGGSIIDFEMNLNSFSKAEAIKYLCDMYGISDDEKKEFKKSPKRTELVENFEQYRMKGNCPGFSRFLSLRGFSFDFIQENSERINEVAREFGFAENIWISEKVYKDVIIFPCYDSEGKIVGAKLRTTDGTLFEQNEKKFKSVAVGKPYHTGLIYGSDSISKSYVLILEGEIDYMTMKILGYKSVLGNLGGVASHREEIQFLARNSEKIVCMYDNDGPGIIETKKLQSAIGRPIRSIVYPKIEGMDKYDVNDLFKAGRRKADFDLLIANSLLLDEIHKTNEQPLYNGRFFYNEEQLKYFDIVSFSYKHHSDISRHLGVKPKELEEMREANVLPTYQGVCYLKGGRHGFYNLLNEKNILTPSGTPEIDPNIKFLISNLCNNKSDNITWLLKAILYKYKNMNDVFIPAIVFHGVGGTGKGLFVKLLATIFGEENTQIGLTQDAIDSRFSAYSGGKLIVEFKEISVENTMKGKRNMNKLKALIMEDKIQVERKGQDPIPVDNIAWFIMSSNEAKPVHLDPSDSGNRRFTIIKTGKFIPKDKPNEEGICGKTIAEAVTNKEKVRNFLAWLHQKYPDIEEISALENEDKKDLEFISESVGNLFFQWFEARYPDINKISNAERDYLLSMYRNEINETEYNDDRYYIRYFNNGLSNRYKIGKPFIRGVQTRGYFIEKEVKGEGCFKDKSFEFTPF